MTSLLPRDFDESVLYFAYGSCLNHASLSASLEMDAAACFIGPGRLKAYRLSFSYPSITEPVCFATILPSPDAVTEGGLFRLPAAVLPALDKREGVGSGRYERLTVAVDTESGRHTAMTYRGLVHLPYEARPSDRYIGLLTAGLRDCGLSPAWCDTLLARLATLPARAEIEIPGTAKTGRA